MSNITYEQSNFKRLIDELLGGISSQPVEFTSDAFKQGFNSLNEKHKPYIEEKSQYLLGVDGRLRVNLSGKEIMNNLYIFQLQVLGDYLKNIKIEDSNINSTLMMMNQKFGSLVDISTKGLLPSGFNSEPPNNLARLQESIASHIPSIEQNLAAMNSALAAQRADLVQVQGASAVRPLAGGSISSYMDTVKKLTDVYSIFNSDLLLKAMSLLSASNLTQAKFGDIFNKMEQLFTLLFINMNDFKVLTSELLSIDTTLQAKINRDTMIHSAISSKFQMQSQGNNKMILIKTIFDAIKLENSQLLQRYLANKEISNDFLKLLLIFITQIAPLSKIYKFLYGNYLKMNSLYEEHVRDKKKVFAYVKERNDDKKRNKRFTIKETDKYLSLKYAADDKNDLNNINTNQTPEYYYFGPYTNTFLNDESNQDIADNTSELILEKLINKKEHVFVLGYGQSGSGKSSALISSNHRATIELGIIPLILKQPRFIEAIDMIEIQIIELIDTDNYKYIKLDGITDIDNNTYNLPSDSQANTTYQFKIVGNEWKRNGMNFPIEQYMLYSVNNRNTDPTSNNPDSSRSHLLIFLKCTHKGNRGHSYLVCGDLAGVENKFDCNDEVIIKKMLKSYAVTKKTKSFDGLYYKNIPYDGVSADYDDAIRNYNTQSEGNELAEPPIIRILQKLIDRYTEILTVVLTARDERRVINSDEVLSLLQSFVYLSKNLPQDFNSASIQKEIIKEEILNRDIDTIEQISNLVPSLIELQSLLISKISQGKNKIKELLGKIRDDTIKDKFNPVKIALDTAIGEQRAIFKERGGKDAAAKAALEIKRKLVRNIILTECPERIVEGIFINKSLKQLREDIKSTLISNFNNDTLYFDKSIFPYCVNTTVKQSKLERFYIGNNSGPLVMNGDIMKVIQNIIGPTELKNLNFIIFTIIKTDILKDYNNPPNPPYVNTNELYYNTHINSDSKKLQDAITSIVGKASTNGFYQKSENAIKLEAPLPSEFDKLQKIAINILERIDTNNDATLIGSLISTEKLNNLIFDKMICSYNSNFNDILNLFNPQYFPVTATPTIDVWNNETNVERVNKYNEMITHKYMKYKSKYLKKLKSRALKK